MKKIILSLVGLLAAAAFAPQASAIPAFARQTGMACNACHQQHFPVLNSFGQAFKASGYTIMGAQGKVEGDEHTKLSIPDTLNAAVLLKVRHVTQSGTTGRATGTAANDGTGTGDGHSGGQLQFGDEFSLFFGGRVAENIGFMIEGNIAGGNPAGGMMAGTKVPVVFDMGGAKLSVIPFTTDALGVAYGYEESSTGMLRSIRWAEHRRDISAQQYAIADNGAAVQNVGGANVNAAAAAGGYTGTATGFAFVVKNDMGYINLTRWTPNFAPGANGQGVPSFDLKSNYLRIAATPSVGDWAMHIAAAVMSGSSTVGVTGGAYGTPGTLDSAIVQTKGTAVDVQAFGQVGGKDLAIYASYAAAPGTTACAPTDTTGAGACNLYNNGSSTRSATVIGADYSVIPHTLHVGAAYRQAKDGATLTAGNIAAGRGNTDNSMTLTVVYDLAQNVALHVNHSARNGDRYNPSAVGGAARAGKNLTTLLLEMAW